MKTTTKVVLSQPRMEMRKVLHWTGHKGTQGEQRQSPTLSLTSALDGVDGQRHAPAALPPGKIQYQLYRRLGGPYGLSGRMRKNLAPTGIQSPDSPACSTDCAIDSNWVIPNTYQVIMSWSYLRAHSLTHGVQTPPCQRLIQSERGWCLT